MVVRGSRRSADGRFLYSAHTIGRRLAASPNSIGNSDSVSRPLDGGARRLAGAIRTGNADAASGTRLVARLLSRVWSHTQVRIRIVRNPSPARIDGLQLDRFQVGEEYDVEWRF